MVAKALDAGTESLNGVLPVDGLCNPLGAYAEQGVGVSQKRYSMAVIAGGGILCDQLGENGICRVKDALCTPPKGEIVRRLTAL